MTGSTWGGLAIIGLSTLFLRGYLQSFRDALVAFGVAGGTVYILLAFPFTAPAFHTLVGIRGSF